MQGLATALEVQSTCWLDHYHHHHSKHLTYASHLQAHSTACALPKQLNACRMTFDCNESYGSTLFKKVIITVCERANDEDLFPGDDVQSWVLHSNYQAHE